MQLGSPSQQQLPETSPLGFALVLEGLSGALLDLPAEVRGRAAGALLEGALDRCPVPDSLHVQMLRASLGRGDTESSGRDDRPPLEAKSSSDGIPPARPHFVLRLTRASAAESSLRCLSFAGHEFVNLIRRLR